MDHLHWWRRIAMCQPAHQEHLWDQEEKHVGKCSGVLTFRSHISLFPLLVFSPHIPACLLVCDIITVSFRFHPMTGLYWWHVTYCQFWCDYIISHSVWCEIISEQLSFFYLFINCFFSFMVFLWEENVLWHQAAFYSQYSEHSRFHLLYRCIFLHQTHNMSEQYGSELR